MKKGFTLIELLVVIAIIALLSSIIISSLISARDKAANARTISQNREFAQSFLLYSSDHGDAYPTTTYGENINGFTFVCLGQGCVFNNGAVDDTVNTAVSSYISDSANTAVKEYSIGTQGYRYKGTVYTCTEESSNGCTEGQVFYAFSGPKCPSNAVLALTDSVTSLCTQDLESYVHGRTSGTATDTDGDTVPDSIDNCRNTPNTDQTDSNGNSIGDACETFVCKGIVTANCSDYIDVPTCDLHSGNCRWNNYQAPSCYGNYNFNCSVFDGNNVSCGLAPGCSYDYNASTCNNGQQVGNCDGYGWGQTQCLTVPNCNYSPGSPGSCVPYSPIQCSWLDQSTCTITAGCAWEIE